MKPGVTIINTARGKLIDSDALIAGLESAVAFEQNQPTRHDVTDL